MDSVLLANSLYHSPVLSLNDQNKNAIVLDVIKDFILTKSKLKKVQEILDDEMKLGLALNPTQKSSLIMAITYVTDFIDGSESGDYLSLDLGSTNFRVLLTRLNRGGNNQFEVKHYTVPNELRKGNSMNLFDYLASCIKDFISEYLPDSTERIALGFTFSFPMTQQAIDVALLETWTKNFDCPDAVGKNAAQLLQEAIDRRGDLNIETVAILNDTTGTLVKGAYLEPDCAIGVIIGSGSNACYIETVDKIEKWTDREILYPNAKQVIIDMECGGFGDNGVIDFAKTRFDSDLDSEALFPNSYTFEKLYGGQFLGDIIRRVLIALTEKEVLFSGVITEQLRSTDCVTTADVSIIESEQHFDDHIRALSNKLGYDSISADDVSVIKHVCAVVSIRGATILSAVLAKLLERINRPTVTIAVDGSVYEKHPKFHQLMTDFIRELCPNKAFKIILASDGSGIGAGLVAAIATKIRKS